MKGIILAGGTGSRLLPLTKVTNKHLLPVFGNPMIYYPLRTLIGSGIRDIMIVSGKGHAGHFLELLGFGSEFGIHLSYEVQEKPGGIAQALALCENFAGDEMVTVILGDNIFEETFEMSELLSGAQIFVTPKEFPQKYGVVDIKNGKIVSIEEKPESPKSNIVQTGLYIYDHQVWDIIRTLKPSNRDELEITDVNNEYLRRGNLSYIYVRGAWFDAGSIESLADASEWVRRNWKGRNDIPV